MNILVLDTIHGGEALAQHLSTRGHRVDAVDVYRSESGISTDTALGRRYDLIIAPVHLDPDHPLMKIDHTPYITHHEAVFLVLNGTEPHPCVEITGARGKTTTAYAIAHLLPGKGVLHTSRGTWECPKKHFLWKKSITPASAIDAAFCAATAGGWLVAEESLGVSGIGDIGVLCSTDDYAIAGGKKSALSEKIRLLSRCRQVVVPEPVEIPGTTVIPVAEAVSISGDRCTYSWNDCAGSFVNPLLSLAGYRTPLALAATVACLFSIDPAPLADFRALKGRMAISREEDEVLVVDNANSGTNAENAIAAARHARELAPSHAITLVIGQEAEHICEGFPPEQVIYAIEAIKPRCAVIVGYSPEIMGNDLDATTQILYADDLEQGRALARENSATASIVLAVKTWR